MPGAYAHICVVNDARERAESAGLRDDTLYALGTNLKFLEMGSVSPDYPYLAIKPGQKRWADAMHYTRNATLLRTGVAEIFLQPPEVQPKLIAWLMGFAAHMVTDLTIHPVVQMRVGPYQGNESEHRRCEMHQDAFIFPRRMNLGDTGLSRHLSTGIAACHRFENEDEVDEAVNLVWTAMLAAAYPDLQDSDKASPDSWHRGFRKILSAMAGLNRLFPFSRHVSAHANLAYPVEKDIDSSYIYQLQTPEGPMDYLLLYERSVANVLSAWKGLDEALTYGRSDALDRLEDWNLDTGRSVQTNQLVFWKEAA